MNATATTKISGITYLRTGRPLYHVQIGSYHGGYLSRHLITAERAEVRAFAGHLAREFVAWSETSQSYFSDALLMVKDINLIAQDGSCQGAKVACYRWDPSTKTWHHSTGATIGSVESLAD